MNPKLRIASICATALLTATPPAAAQSPQYVAPGSRARAPEDAREELEREKEEARWQLGKLKVDPRFWIREAGYRDNVFGASDQQEAISDYTVTAGAGLIAYLNLGRKLVVKGSLLPEYSWWDDLSELSALNTAAEVELFGLFNNATTQVGWRSTSRQGQLNDELETPVETDYETVFLDWTLELTGRFSLFGRLSAAELQQKDLGSQGPPTTLTLLDRDEEVLRLGLEYAPQPSLVLALGVEATTADFVQDPAQRSNSGTSPLFSFEIRGEQLTIDGNLVSTRLDFDSGFSFDEMTGSLRASRTIGAAGLVTGYVDRSLVYSALNAGSYYLDETIGLAAEAALGRRFRIQAFAETGENNFHDLATVAGIPRLDEVDSLGAALVFRLSDRVALAVRGRRTEYDSTSAELDRSITSVGIDLGLSQDLFLRR